MTNLREALLPCPFCGGVAESDSQRGYRNMTTGNLENAAAIYCTSCNADMTWCYRDMPEVERDQVMALLTEQWNTRAALSAPAPVGEPVAYRWRTRRHDNSNAWQVVQKFSPALMESCIEFEPLYTTPQPSPGWDEALQAAAKIVEGNTIS